MNMENILNSFFTVTRRLIINTSVCIEGCGQISWNLSFVIVPPQYLISRP